MLFTFNKQGIPKLNKVYLFTLIPIMLFTLNTMNYQAELRDQFFKTLSNLDITKIEINYNTDRTLDVVFSRFRGFSFTITLRQKPKGVTGCPTKHLVNNF